MKDYSHITSVEQMQFDMFSNVAASLSVFPKPSMLELGCSTALYSTRFHELLNGNCENVCVELRATEIPLAKQNIPTATFFHGWVGERVHFCEGVPVGVDVIDARKIPLEELWDIPSSKRFDIIHMDVQGAETSILAEMAAGDFFKRTGYLFCSLHGTHDDCMNIINNCGLEKEFLYAHPTSGGYGDGLIVVKFIHP